MVTTGTVIGETHGPYWRRTSDVAHSAGYSRYDLDDLPARWALYLSPSDDAVKRLVVFVHGFRGSTVGTWMDFPDLDLSRAENGWWLQADLLFIGYQSTSDSITGVANRIRSELPRFFPTPYAPAVRVDDVPVRSDLTTPYEQLVVVGHSLGGVVLRQALCDSAQDWINRGRPEERPVLLQARNRYFSPASAGFRPAGKLGLLRATSFWAFAEMFLRRSSAYTDLQQNSLVLQELRERTVQYVVEDEQGDLVALRATIVWANPDEVVLDRNYQTDYGTKSWDGFTHSNVCKPSNNHQRPWRFVESGEG
jgi:pimeloyl-ACP methyl ester carboxylesterase